LPSLISSYAIALPRAGRVRASPFDVGADGGGTARVIGLVLGTALNEGSPLGIYAVAIHFIP
jgi:hypothetical protein